MPLCWEEKAPWARRILDGNAPEPYHQKRGLVRVSTILGTDDEQLMKRLYEAIERHGRNEVFRVPGLPLKTQD